MKCLFVVHSWTIVDSLESNSLGGVVTPPKLIHKVLNIDSLIL